MDAKQVSFLIACNDVCPYAKKNSQWLQKRYRSIDENCEFIMGSCDSPYYSVPKQINQCFKKSTGNIIVITSANILFDLDIVYNSLEYIGEHSYVRPYVTINYLNEKSSDDILSSDPSLDLNKFIFSTYKPVEDNIGNLIITSREKFESVGGLSEYDIEWNMYMSIFLNELEKKYKPPMLSKSNCIWSLFYPKTDYPMYARGINLDPFYQFMHMKKKIRF